MSHSVTIVKTIFKNLTGNETYGIRCYSSEESYYSNYIETLEELNNLSDDEIIEIAKDINIDAKLMIEWAEENSIVHIE